MALWDGFRGFFGFLILMTLTKLALRSKLLRRGVDPGRLARQVAEQPDLLVELFDGLGAREPAIKYGSAKVLRALSDLDPAVLYPEIDVFIERLDSDNKFMHCDALLVLANLAAVDTERRIDRILDRYCSPIQGPDLMVAATVVKGAATIASFKPSLAERIAPRICGVEEGTYKTPECRDVILGQAIDALAKFYQHLGASERKPVRRLVHTQLENPQPATRKKAAKFLSKWTN